MVRELSQPNSAKVTLARLGDLPAVRVEGDVPGGRPVSHICAVTVFRDGIEYTLDLLSKDVALDELTSMFESMAVSLQTPQKPPQLVPLMFDADRPMGPDWFELPPDGPDVQRLYLHKAPYWSNADMAFAVYCGTSDATPADVAKTLAGEHGRVDPPIQIDGVTAYPFRSGAQKTLLRPGIGAVVAKDGQTYVFWSAVRIGIADVALNQYLSTVKWKAVPAPAEMPELVLTELLPVKDKPLDLPSTPATFVKTESSIKGFAAAFPPAWVSKASGKPDVRLMMVGKDDKLVATLTTRDVPDGTPDLGWCLEREHIKDDASADMKRFGLVKIGENSAVSSAGSAVVHGDHMALFDYAIYRNGQAYTLTFISLEPSMDSQLSLCDQIAASLTVPTESAVVSDAPKQSTLDTPAPPTSADPASDKQDKPTGGEALKIADRAKAPTPAEALADWKAIAGAWHLQTKKVTELMPNALKGEAKHGLGGIAILEPGKHIESVAKFKPPVTFQITALTNVNDLRLAYPANQIIFNWEMVPTELRIDGGPASGKHLPGAGRLPANVWVGIEMTVTDKDLTLYVNGMKVYAVAGDFSQINAPLKITSHTGTTSVRSVRVIK